MSAQFHASAGDLNAIREISERYGFCLVKNVLGSGDLATLLSGMKAASQAAGARPLPDLLSIPDLRAIYFDPRMLEIGRALLGPRLVYDGEGTLNFEETIDKHTLTPFMKLHCDAVGMPLDLNSIWASGVDAIYPAYRFGIYFQDYRAASGALKVALGSHRGDPRNYEGEGIFTETVVQRAFGPYELSYFEPRVPLYNLPSEPGDVVIWNLRSYHSAGAKCFVADPSFAAHPLLELRFAKHTPLFVPPPGPRNALFFDYAAPTPEIDLYVKYRSRLKSDALDWRISNTLLDEDGLTAEAERHGVEIRLDGLIVRIAERLSQLHGEPPSSVRDAAIGPLTQRLHRLLLRHREYSPYFPLFDRLRFARAANPETGLAMAVDEILAAQQIVAKAF